MKKYLLLFFLCLLSCFLGFTGCNTDSPSQRQNFSAPLAAPKNLTTTKVTSSSITLVFDKYPWPGNWDWDFIDYFEIKWNETNSFETANCKQFKRGKLDGEIIVKDYKCEIEIKDLKCDTLYYIWVTGHSRANLSNRINQGLGETAFISVKTEPESSQEENTNTSTFSLEKPTGLKCGKKGDFSDFPNNIYFKWDPVSYASYYRIRWSSGDFFTTNKSSYSTIHNFELVYNQTSVFIKDLDPDLDKNLNSIYTFEVEACCVKDKKVYESGYSTPYSIYINSLRYTQTDE